MRIERGKRTLGILTAYLRKGGQDVRFRGVAFKRWAIGVLTLAPMTDLSRRGDEP